VITIGKSQQFKATPATIIAIDFNGYRVRDDAGRIMRVTSTASWSIGLRVMVLGGQIIGQAGSAPKAKIYSV
jgi:hypothetical protein